ncbi:MAG: NAD(P)H-hydrate epimerase [Bythopirellula sp.]|nr:NAD(P)H-hydrate epimerase [Bythopirellula sp.]
MNLLTRAESRDVDRCAIEELGIPGIVLMENAGRGVVDVLLSREATVHTVLILCGKGNNGGDGFVIARHLAIRGVEARIALLASPNEFAGDAKTNFQILERMQVPITDLSHSDNIPAALDELVAGADWLVDAMLGTGAVGEPREPYRSAIAWLNQQAIPKLAVDLPSGLDCDTGEPSEATVRADVTCTFHAPKVGFSIATAREFLGELHVVSIGIPQEHGVGAVKGI